MDFVISRNQIYTESRAVPWTNKHPHVHSWEYSSLHTQAPATYPVHSHHLATSQPGAGAHSGKVQPQWNTARQEALTGHVSALGVTGTGNSRVSVLMHSLEGEVQVSGRHNPWPFRFLTLWRESYWKRAQCRSPTWHIRPWSHSPAARERSHNSCHPPTHPPHSEILQVLSCQPPPIPHSPISILLDFNPRFLQPCLAPPDWKLHLE